MHLPNMGYTLTISILFLSLAWAAPPKTENEIIAQFFGYAETIRSIQARNMLMVTIKFVQEIVDSVPNEHRGPGTAALESYINHGRELIERGTSDEKYNYFYNLLNIINTVKGNIDPSTHESQVIGLTSLGLLNVSRDFVREGEKFHNKFLQGASQMKAKLTPTTIARESDLFNVINECINSDFHHREDLIQQFLSFKNRY